METKTVKQLYSQNELAEILGVSKGTFSKWLRENSVSPKQQRGQRKFYDETVIEQYKKDKEEHPAKDYVESTRVSTVQLLQETVKDKQEEIDYLRKQLEEKDAQLKQKDQVIADFGSKFAKLADQAQQLNLTDKADKVQMLQSGTSREKKQKEGSVFVSDSKQETVKSRWWEKLWK